mmetsp:Transcript_7704/g.15478  ORF Transcript_7704/g.15478 Transcript_7704/m.15478 type:complete len:260 (+) Transcript_7704:9831-10610(+)
MRRRATPLRVREVFFGVVVGRRTGVLWVLSPLALHVSLVQRLRIDVLGSAIAAVIAAVAFGAHRGRGGCTILDEGRRRLVNKCFTLLAGVTVIVLCGHFLPYPPSEPKIAKEAMAVGRKENVCRLEVPVHDTMLMEEVQSHGSLGDDLFNDSRGKASANVVTVLVTDVVKVLPQGPTGRKVHNKSGACIGGKGVMERRDEREGAALGHDRPLDVQHELIEHAPIQALRVVKHAHLGLELHSVVLAGGLLFYFNDEAEAA